MIDITRLKDVLTQYKQKFISAQWKEEKYKWEAVKWFQDHWDVNATDFPTMLNTALDKTFNLLASANNFPKGMIVGFAKSAPEEVRAMFIDLFDESKDVYERIDAFKLRSSKLLERYGNGAAQHYQLENAITTYLWLRYPDRYYIYKFSEVKVVAAELEADYRFKKGAYADNVRNFIKLYDESGNKALSGEGSSSLITIMGRNKKKQISNRLLLLSGFSLLAASVSDILWTIQNASTYTEFGLLSVIVAAVIGLISALVIARVGFVAISIYRGRFTKNITGAILTVIMLGILVGNIVTLNISAREVMISTIFKIIVEAAFVVGLVLRFSYFIELNKSYREKHNTEAGK